MVFFCGCFLSAGVIWACWGGIQGDLSGGTVSLGSLGCISVVHSSFHVIGSYYQLSWSKNGFQKRSSHPLCRRTLDLDVRDLIECCHLAKVFKISHCLRKLEKLKTSYCSHIKDI